MVCLCCFFEKNRVPIDIVLVVNIIFGDSIPDNQQSCASDANGDGIINVLDVVLIVNYILSF